MEQRRDFRAVIRKDAGKAAVNGGCTLVRNLGRGESGHTPVKTVLHVSRQDPIGEDTSGRNHSREVQMQADA